MPDFEHYLKNSNWLNQYQDLILRDYVCKFVRDRYKDMFQARPSSAQNAVACLSRYLSSRTLNEITATDIIDYIRDNKQDSNRTLPLFFSFLVKNGCYHGTPIARLCEFEDMISSSAVTSEKMIYLLSLDDADYRAYLASPLYAKRRERWGYSVFFFTIDMCSVQTDEVAGFIDRYVRNYKWSSDDSPTRMIRFLEGLNYCVSMLFSKPGAVSVNVENVCRVLEEAKKKYQPPTPGQIRLALFSLLDAMVQSGYVIDQNVAYAARIARHFHVPSIDLLDDVLTSEHPERYTVYKTATGRHAGQEHCIYINISCDTVRNEMANFLSLYGHTDAGIAVFCRYFDESLNKKSLSGFQDLCYATYLEQITFFRPFKDNEVIIAALTAFYLHVQQNHVANLFSREGIPDVILQRNDIWRLLLDGYTVVVHNPLERVPETDKWVLCYLTSRHDRTIDIKSLDFTTTKCDVFRAWVKTYIWHADVQMETKRHPYYVMKELLNYLYALKTGDKLTIFTKPHVPFDTITANEAAAVRNYVFTLQENTRTRVGYVYNLRNLLTYVSENDLGIIEPGVFHNLTYTQDNDYENTAPVPDDELQRLTDAFQKRSAGDNLAALCYSVAYIVLETELRGKTVLKLQKDCIRETAKKGEYVIAVEEKTSAGEIVYHPVTNYVVREIREIARRTEEYRQQCTNKHLSNTLFVVPGNKTGVFKRLTYETVNRYIKQCSDDAGIPAYTLKNLRSTHMTNVLRHKIRRSMSNMEQTVLSGHKHSRTDDIHYVRLDIREMLEATNGIIIGDASIKGTVENDRGQSFITPDNLVSHDCGYCKSHACNELSYIDCLVCKDFVTMPSRLQFFKDRIAIIDKQIQMATVPHDKEDLTAIKRLLVMYIERILEVMEDSNNATI